MANKKSLEKRIKNSPDVKMGRGNQRSSCDWARDEYGEGVTCMNCPLDKINRCIPDMFEDAAHWAQSLAYKALKEVRRQNEKP